MEAVIYIYLILNYHIIVYSQVAGLLNMMFNNHYCIQGICNRGFTLDCGLDILWIGFIFVTDKNWFYLVPISLLITNKANYRLIRRLDQEVISRRETSNVLKRKTELTRKL